MSAQPRIVTKDVVAGLYRGALGASILSAILTYSATPAWTVLGFAASLFVTHAAIIYLLTKADDARALEGDYVEDYDDGIDPAWGIVFLSIALGAIGIGMGLMW